MCNFCVLSVLIPILCFDLLWGQPYTVDWGSFAPRGAPNSRRLRHSRVKFPLHSSQYASHIEDGRIDCPELTTKPPSSFLWQISSKPPSFLFGTLHVAYTEVLPHLAPSVMATFVRSENVYIELDLTQPTSVAQIKDCQQLPGDTTLDQVLPSRLYNRIHQVLQRSKVESTAARWQSSTRRPNQPKRLDISNKVGQNWKRKRPIWVLLLLLQGMVWREKEDTSDQTIPILDLLLAQQAKISGKKNGAIEEVEDQCEPLNNIENDKVAMALNMTLSSIESMIQTSNEALDPYIRIRASKGEAVQPLVSGHTNSMPLHAFWIAKPVGNLIEYYNCGSEELLLNAIRSSQRFGGQLYPDGTLKPEERNTLVLLDSYLNDELLTKRNRRMATRIDQILHETQLDGRSAFFALGAAHLLGNDSVIDHLERSGYEIFPISRQSKEFSHYIRSHQSRTEFVDYKAEHPIIEDNADEKHFRSTTSRGVQNNVNLPSETEVPKFSPRYVNFENTWIKIEDFNVRNTNVRAQENSLYIPKSRSGNRPPIHDGTKSKQKKKSERIHEENDATSRKSSTVITIVVIYTLNYMVCH